MKIKERARGAYLHNTVNLLHDHREPGLNHVICHIIVFASTVGPIKINLNPMVLIASY